MTDHLDMSELLDVFLEEADEQLQRLDEGILALEKDPSDLEIVRDVFRAAHTLKGSSASMGFEQIASLTHTMENLLDRLRSGQQSVTPAAINALLSAVDALRALVAKAHGDGDSSDVSMDDVLEGLRRASDSPGGGTTLTAKTGAVPPPGTAGCTRIEVRFAADCLMPSIRAFMAFSALAGCGEIAASHPEQDHVESLQSGDTLIIDLKPSVSREQILKTLGSICEIEASIPEEKEEERPADLPQQSSAASCSARTEAADAHSHAMQTVRVGVDRLDTLMNLVGELVIDRTRIGQTESMLSARYDGDSLMSGLTEASLHLGRVINELQEQIMRIRMLPVEQVFNRFPRMVRDLAMRAGKRINFAVYGQETELDRSILEDIVDPISHLLRNSIDHGIETPEERAAAGKPETATVQLTAKQEENRIVIEVEDDGRGISVEKIRIAAVEKGMLSREAAERMSDRDCLQLIFAAGMSTAKTVTDVSGRGVGMDVVKSNIERLSGMVDLQTEVGVGTRISLRLPLTLAIVQALITSVGDRVFAIPLTAVVETTRYESSEVSSIQGNPALKFRDAVLPLVNLAKVFPSRHIGARKTSGESVLVVVRTGGQQIGICVDRLIGEQEVVIKSLGSYFGKVDGIAGAALLGDGRIALIVDVSGVPAILERENAMAA